MIKARTGLTVPTPPKTATLRRPRLFARMMTVPVQLDLPVRESQFPTQSFGNSLRTGQLPDTTSHKLREAEDSTDLIEYDGTVMADIQLVLPQTSTVGSSRRFQVGCGGAGEFLRHQIKCYLGDMAALWETKRTGLVSYVIAT